MDFYNVLQWVWNSQLITPVGICFGAALICAANVTQLSERF